MIVELYEDRDSGELYLHKESSTVLRGGVQHAEGARFEEDAAELARCAGDDPGRLAFTTSELDLRDADEEWRRNRRTVRLAAVWTGSEKAPVQYITRPRQMLRPARRYLGLEDHIPGRMAELRQLAEAGTITSAELAALGEFYNSGSQA